MRLVPARARRGSRRPARVPNHTTHATPPPTRFQDEVDALLGRRRDSDHEAVTAMKTEFMQARTRART